MGVKKTKIPGSSELTMVPFSQNHLEFYLKGPLGLCVNGSDLQRLPDVL